MPTSFRLIPLADTAANLRSHRLAAPGLVVLAAMALLGAALLTATQRPFSASQAATGGRTAATLAEMPWAGGLESTPTGDAVAATRKLPAPVTSAAYTSGFDEKAAGLGPLPPQRRPAKPSASWDPRACPDDLNCSFRPVRAGAVQARRPLQSTARPAKAPPPADGLTLLTASLHLPAQLPGYIPSPKTLLKPFTFVGSTVAGLVKKL